VKSSEPTPAFLFDLDGVVVDSNGLHVESWKEVARRHGFECADPDHIGKCGLRTGAVIRDLLRWPVSEEEAARIGEEKEEIYREWIQADGIHAIPGVVDFLKSAAALGIPCAVGSSAPRKNVDICLRALALDTFFGTTVSGEDVQRGKPAPDIFHRAAEGIGMPPEDCLVFEDAPAGIEAAHAASMRALAVLTSHTPAEVAAADWIVCDFMKLTPQQVRADWSPLRPAR